MKFFWLAMIGWLAGVTVLVGQSSGLGASSSSDLVVKFNAASRQRSPSAMRHLADRKINGSTMDYLFTAAGCGPSAEVNDGHIEIHLDDGSVCGRVAIKQEGGRWFLNPWADPLDLGG